MKTAIYNGKLITPAEVLENKVLVIWGNMMKKSMRTEGMSAPVLSILILTRSNRSFSRVLPA